MALKLPFFSKTPKVGVLHLRGIIAESSRLNNCINLKSLKAPIDKMFEQKLDLVVLVINSPGGSPVQSELICNYIRLKVEQAGVEMIAVAEDLAASGGYWLACTAPKIYALKTSIIGSIGVISAGFGFVDAMKKLGVERRVYTQGENKQIIDPFSPTKKEKVAIITKVQEDMHAHFIDHVKTSRGKRLDDSDAKLFSGAFWSGNDALKLGLIDGIDSLANILQGRYGDDYKLMEFPKVKKGLLSKFSGTSLTENLTADVKAALIQESWWQRYHF